MLDNLRNHDDSSPFFQDDGEEVVNETPDPGTGFKKRWKLPVSFFGIKPQQLFILLLMLLMVVCLLGIMFLMITGKIVPQFLMN
jgi:hypothetical protein